MKNWLRRAACLLAGSLLLGGGTGALAAVSYDSYTYSYWGKPVASPAGVTVETTYNGRQLGVGRLSEPKDLYIAPNGDAYLADSGNNRVLIFDENWKLKASVTELTDGQGKMTALKAPGGIFMDKRGHVYIADTGNKRVLQCEGTQVLQIYEQPANDIQFTGIDYLPQRIVVDDAGYVYVLCKGIYQGALVYENGGAFVGYYGTNYVEAGLGSALQLLWKRLMTDEQRSKTALFLPEEFTSFTIDGDGFIYTATEVTSSSKNQVKKINPLGVDVMDANERVQSAFQGRYGDLELRWYGGKVLQTRFVDISYDPAGFLNVLDRERGRIFQYDTEGNLIFLAGGTASQEGTFKKVTAIDNRGDEIYVLDEQKANITVFALTAYGREMREAVGLYTAGRFSDSKALWEQVLRKNSHCEIAYSGIGKALYEEGQYAEAMRYFKRGYDRPGYNKAFSDYRLQLLRQLIPWVGSAAVVLGLLIFLVGRVRRLRAEMKKYTQ